jgi:NTE family protein
MTDSPGHDARTTALVLTGGGARAAYQVGVLSAIDRIRRECRAGPASPFGIFAGTSAGAINACALASRADAFGRGVGDLLQVWSGFRVGQVYRTDTLGVIRTGAPWLTMMSLGWLVARFARIKPRSLLDNHPLRELLLTFIAWENLDTLMDSGELAALAVTASSYTSGRHVTFYQSQADIEPWQRSQRIAVRARVRPEHLLASSAIPFVFPAVSLHAEADAAEWFGDGSMRQIAPISPAIHLGARKVLVVGAGRLHEPPGRRVADHAYPSVAQIAGHALSNIFLDALRADVERLQRINATLELIDPAGRTHTELRPIEALVIAPSQRLDDLAAAHVADLPLTIRALLGAAGSQSHGGLGGGAAFASYLLFEASYTRTLIALGEADTLARRADVIRFFGW